MLNGSAKQIEWWFFVKRLKDNSYDIARLIINQIGIAIFAIVLYVAMATVGENSRELYDMLKVASSVASTLFYWALIYTVMWEIGAKDRIKIDSGKAEDFKSKGFLIALLANLPNIILSSLAIIFKAVYMIFGIEAFNTAMLLVSTFMRFIASMYIGIISGICNPIEPSNLEDLAQSIGYLIMPLLTVLVCHLAYTLGKNNFKFFATKNTRQS